MHQDWKFKVRPRLALVGAALVAACGAPAGSPVPAGERGPIASTHVAHREARFGVPTFVWLEPGEAPPAGTRAADVAWQALRQLAPTYRLGPAALAATQLRGIHDTGRGTVIAHFEQQVESVEVFRLGINVAMNRSLQPVAASGYLAPQAGRKSDAFALSESQAVAAAVQAMTDSAHVEGAQLAPSGPPVHATPPRSHRIWFPQPDGLVPAYYVEVDLQLGGRADSALHSFAISATDGSVLFDRNLTAADSYSYRVWADKDDRYAPWDGPQGTDFSPHPTGKRDGTNLTFQPSQLVTLANAPFSRNDPWLPAGATEARGNNAIAYADLVTPDGLSAGDLMLTTSSPGSFDYTLDVAKEDPAGSPRAIRAVTTNFFYIVNWMHDYFYDAGWDEASFNPQLDNYGRGGIPGDPIRAEAQDSSGRNNANASTPADGTSPRIQMYLWDPTHTFHVNAPASLAGDKAIGAASFGLRMFDLTQDVVLVDDGVGTTSDGCETPYKNAAALAGKLMLVDRGGTCGYDFKAYYAQQAGAVGIVVVNNRAGGPSSMAASNPPPPMPVTVPAVMVGIDDGNAMKAALAAGTAVNVTIQSPLVNNDSSLDGTIVAHEWGHILSNRIVGNGNGLGSNQGSGMGEGWSDFVALLTIVRPEDQNAPANANWSGVYAVSPYAAGPGDNASFDGIRRYPYSTDMTKAPLTFKHIQNGVALPTNPPPLYGGNGSSNAEVHATGEVWTNMLWDCYAALLRQSDRYTFAQANRTMRDYLVAGLKLTPISPTILEARDAILAAAYANDQKDYELLVGAFARRGAGIGAVGPDRGSSTNGPVSESFASGADFTVVSVTLDDAVHSCDHDGILDNDEVGHLTVKLRNTGSIPLAASATVASSNPAVSDDSGGMLTFPVAAPYTTTTATMNVTMKGAAMGQSFDVTVVVNAQNKAVPGAVTVKRTYFGNYDIVPGSSSDDTMDDANPVWNIAFDPKLDVSQPWQHDAQNGRWSIPDTASPSDHYLVSPPLSVAATGSFGFTLKHRFSFEADMTNKYDGAVIELSSDGGMTWKDVGPQLTTNGYSGKVWAQNQPLAGRDAFTAQSAGYPSFISTTADFGAAYQNQTVRLRFRIGTDPAAGGPGWDLDELRLTGITNTPFSTRALTHNSCQNRPPQATAGADLTVAPGDLVTLRAAASDPDKDLLTYRWVEAGGPMVMLDNYQAAEPTFIAPQVTEPTLLTFSLVVNDGTVDSPAVSQRVNVVPAAPPQKLPPSPPAESSGCTMASRTASGSSGVVLALAGLALALAFRRRGQLLGLLCALALVVGCNPPAAAPQHGLFVTRSGSADGKIVAQPGGIDCGSVCAALYADGTMVTLTATPDASGQFSGWKGACSGSSPTCVVVLSQAQNVEAVFTGPPGPLSVAKSGDGDGTIVSVPQGLDCGATCEASFPADRLVTLHAEASGQSVFIGWSGDCQGAVPTCTVHANAARSITARFEARVCSADEICWERPFPAGNGLGAVQVITPNDIWSAGERGQVVHWDGKRWRRISSGTTRTLRGLWAAGSGDLWVVGDGGTILHWNGTALSPVASGTTSDLRAVWGSGPGDVWTVGDGGAVRHWDGSAWAEKVIGAAADESLRAVHGSDAANVWAVSTLGNAFRFDGSAWIKSAIAQRRLLAVWTGGPASAWAVGDAGAALSYDGTKWTSQPFSTAASLVAVYGPSADAVWVATSASIVLHREANAWKSQSSPTGAPLQAAHGVANNLWLVGSRGGMVRWDGTTLRLVSAGSEPRNLAAVWGQSSARLWMVGAGGLVGRFADGTLTLGESGASADLLAVHGSSDSDVWAVGEHGTAVHQTGTGANVGWQATDTHTPRTLNAVFSRRPDDTWAVGELGTVLHHDGAKWVTMLSGAKDDLYAVWSGAEDDVWIAGATELLHFNGTAWDWESGVKMPIYGLGGLSGGDLWAVGAAGSLSHYQGNVWRAVETGTTVNLRSLAVSSHGDLWIVGEQGAVLRGSPGKLLPLQSGTVGNLYNVAAPDPQTAWLVGASGVLTYRR